MGRKNTNVLLYCRVSSEEQKTNGCSLEEQERQLRSYCQNCGYCVLGVYHEDYSACGPNLNRPEMKKMYDYCKKNRGTWN